MASMKYREEELNYFRVCKVTTCIIPNGLRQVFKQEWDTHHQATYGLWQDMARNGMDFYGMAKNKKIKSRELSIMKNGNTNEWDCTCLFYGILYSDSIKPTLNATIKKSVDELRKFRNEVFAHTKDGKLKEANFKMSIDKVITSFTDLKLDTTEIEEIRNQTSFPTEELEDIKKQLEKEKKRNEEPQPFCVLPAKPSHETVSRLNEVDQINEEMERLRNTKNNEVTVVYLSGNPGCGKSEVARQIGERFFDEKSTEMKFVMTVNASNIDTLLQSHVEFACKLRCDEESIAKISTSENLSKEGKVNDLKCLVAPKVEGYKSWLIVVDNVSDLKSVSKYWPQAGEKTSGVGQILVTTQDSSSIPSDPHTYHLPLKKGMNRDDAVKALCDISGMSCHNDITLQVAKALDFQLLALACAAVYMKHIKSTDWTKYLQKLKEGKREVTEKEYQKRSLTYPKTMTAAVRMAVDKEVSEDKVMRHAFEFLSVIAPEPIPLQYVVQYVMNCLSDEDEDCVASTIRSSSLVLSSEEDEVQEVRVHQVVHSCLQSTVNLDETEFKVDILIINVVLAFIDPVTSVEALEYIEGILGTQRLIVHFLSISSKISDIFDDPSDLAISVSVNIFHVIASLLQIGDICSYYAKYDACRIFYKISLKIQEKEFNRSCLSIAETLNSLSKVFRNLDQNKEAEDCSERASAIRKRQQTFSFCRQTDNNQTPMHNVNVYDKGGKANELITLGNSCLNQKNFMQAKSLFKRALKIRDKLYGNSHPLVAIIHNKIGETLCLMKNDEEAKTHFEAALAIEDRIYNFIISILDSSLYALAKLFWDKGQYDNAEKYIEKAKEVEKLKEKEMHPSLGNALNYAGKTLCMMGKYDDAKRCLEIAQKIQGEMQNEAQVAELVTLLNTQGEIMRKMGQYKESKTILSRALKIQKIESPSFANTLKNLGKTHVAMCQLNKAKECYEQAIRNEQNAYGKDDPRIINSTNEMGEILRLMGNCKDAEVYLREAQTIQEKVAPFNKTTHPNLANILKELGDVLYDKGKSEEAKQILQKAVAIQEDAYNTVHSVLVDTLYTMSDTLLDMRKYDEAKELLERALSNQKLVFHDEHPDVATTLNKLAAAVCLDFCQYEDAEQHLKNALAIQEKAYGKEHPQLAETLNNLGNLYRNMHQYEKAEEQLKRALKIQEEAYGKEHPELAETLNNLGNLYRDMHQYEKAKEHLKRALKIQEKAYGKEHPQVAETLNNLSNLKKDLKRTSDERDSHSETSAKLPRKS